MLYGNSAAHFGRAIVMPNLKPPVTTTAAAISYRESIMKALPSNSSFDPLMTLYLTDSMKRDEIKLASESIYIYLDFISLHKLFLMFRICTSRKKWRCLCCKAVSCWCHNQFSRWRHGFVWKMPTCS